ncbi:MAG TPA: hypothetical protein VG164_03180 [Trebonia sp.]|nr:hypothetical protein [Trebonia sp.]
MTAPRRGTADGRLGRILDTGSFGPAGPALDLVGGDEPPGTPPWSASWQPMGLILTGRVCSVTNALICWALCGGAVIRGTTQRGVGGNSVQVKLTRPWRAAAITLTTATVAAVTALTMTVPATTATAATATAATAAATVQAAASGTPYPCTATGGPNADASAIGWLGNGQGATACLGGSFYVPNGINTSYGFGVYNDSPTTWANADGYLPALVTSFTSGGARVSITNFGDRVVIGGHPYVAVYSRVAVHNPTSKPLTAGPLPSAGLVPLNSASDTVAPGRTADHDYVVAEDRFGGGYAWPTAAQLARAGGYDQHFAHMRHFWNRQLAAVTGLSLPDRQLADAWKSGFIYMQIDRSGNELDTGTNGYHQEYEHDVIGILAGLFNEGYFSGARALLDEADRVVGTNTQYSDGTWVYPWLWAVYVEKTGDTKFLADRFASPGPLGASAQPSIETAAHDIAAARTGPGGIIGETNDIDANGYWTSDNYEALLGLAGYEYLAKAVGDKAETQWAASQYASLLKDVNTTLAATMSAGHFAYLPCSMTEPNSANRCSNPEDANWAAPGVYFNWAWNGYLLGAPLTGPDGVSMADWIDKTLSYGFGRVKGMLPANTFGGYPGEGFYSTAYNAAYGAWGLGSNDYRDQGILSYQFLIDNDQSGPYSWWEGSTAPSTTTPWTGNHPASGGGSSPHSWGIAMGGLGLLDSLVSLRADGALVIGRGVPSGWLGNGRPIVVSNFAAAGGRRVSVVIRGRGDKVTLRLAGRAAGPVIFDVPAFAGNIARASAGRTDEGAGTVTLPAGTRAVTVTLKHAPTA